MRDMVRDHRNVAIRDEKQVQYQIEKVDRSRWIWGRSVRNSNQPGTAFLAKVRSQTQRKVNACQQKTCVAWKGNAVMETLPRASEQGAKSAGIKRQRYLMGIKIIPGPLVPALARGER